MEYVNVDYRPGDPHFDEWEKLEQEYNKIDKNWLRLSRVITTELFHETGLYDELSCRQRSQIDRKNELALQPDLPRTFMEKRSANRSYSPGFPIWSIPILFSFAAWGAGIEKLEEYSKADKFGSQFASNRVKNIHRSLNLSNVGDGSEEARDGFYTRLGPEFRIAKAALTHANEPGDYVINASDLLEAAESAFAQDGTSENLETKLQSHPFSELAPKKLSLEDQRARAAEIFMQSSLLKDGELFYLAMERRVDFLPAGKDTFRLHATNPYAHLYEGTGITNDNYKINQPSLWAERLLDPDPFAELAESSRT